MPAEWSIHESTWLSWPANNETWPGKRLARVEETYLQMLEGLLPNEKVHLLVRDHAAGESVKKRLEKMAIRTRNLILHDIATADPADLCIAVVGACRHCHSEGFKYQGRDAEEFADACELIAAHNLAHP